MSSRPSSKVRAAAPVTASGSSEKPPWRTTATIPAASARVTMKSQSLARNWTSASWVAAVAVIVRAVRPALVTSRRITCASVISLNTALRRGRVSAIAWSRSSTMSTEPAVLIARP